MTFLQYEFTRARSLALFRLGLPLDWSLAEPPARVILSAREDVGAPFQDLLSSDIVVEEGVVAFQMSIPNCGFYKIYRFEFYPAEGEPENDVQRGPSGGLAVGISYMYLYENPAKQATTGSW